MHIVTLIFHYQHPLTKSWLLALFTTTMIPSSHKVDKMGEWGLWLGRVFSYEAWMRH